MVESEKSLNYATFYALKLFNILEAFYQQNDRYLPSCYCSQNDSLSICKVESLDPVYDKFLVSFFESRENGPISEYVPG